MSARQFIVLLDHFNLSHQLETKVEQRTLNCSTRLITTVSPVSPTGHCSTATWTTRSQERGGTCAGLAVLLMDLRNFKHVNDLYGHQVGDELLVWWREAPDDPAGRRSVARVGGDEFGVLLARSRPKLTSSTLRAW